MPNSSSIFPISFWKKLGEKKKKNIYARTLKGFSSLFKKIIYSSQKNKLYILYFISQKIT